VVERAGLATCTRFADNVVAFGPQALHAKNEQGKMIYVYVLYSTAFDRHYIGSSADPDHRLQSHNSGKVKSTAKYKPWIRVYLEECVDRSSAMKREKYLKSGYGRRWLKRNIAE